VEDRRVLAVDHAPKEGVVGDVTGGHLDAGVGGRCGVRRRRLVGDNEGVDRLARIGSDRRAAGCRARAAPAWTDDFSNPFSLIHW